MDRRHFLSAAGAVSLAGVRAGEEGGRRTDPSQERRLSDSPVRALPDRVRLSCNLYSFDDPLRSGEMSLREVVDFCAEQGFAAVDPTGYYFGTYPDVPEPDYTNAIKRHAFLAGVDVSGTGVRNDFTLPDPGDRRDEVAHVLDWLTFASRLGAPVLRVFAGAGDALEDGYARSEVTGWLVDALRRCAGHAADHGVMIVLQNHAEFLHTADQVIGVLEAVDSPWVGLNLDIGSFDTPDPYADIRRAAPYAVTWQIKENVHVEDRAESTDLTRIAEIVRESGYRGYLPLETLGPGDPSEKIPRFREEVLSAFAA